MKILGHAELRPLQTSQIQATSKSPKATSPVKQPWARARKMQWLAAGGVLILIAGGFVAQQWMRAAAPIQYATIPASQGAVVKSVTASGTVNPVLTIIVGSYVSGVIQDILCDYNTVVRKGQLCAKIDPRPYQTAVDQSTADLATARAQLVKDKASLAYAELNNGRIGTLAKAGDASLDAADNAVNVLNQAKAQVEVDQANIQQRQASLHAAQINLGYTDIASPVDGTVVSRNVTIGQTVAASFQTPTLFLIATDLTEMQIDTNVSESDIGALVEGNKVRFTVEAFPGQAFEGTVAQIRQAPQTVQNVITYDVVVAVDNRDLRLKPGMTATAQIITSRRDNVLRVPSAALRFAPSGLAAAGTSAGKAVWVLRKDVAVAVPVVTGLDDDTFTEITGGLSVGDLVITSEQRAKTTAAARPRPLGF